MPASPITGRLRSQSPDYQIPRSVQAPRVSSLSASAPQLSEAMSSDAVMASMEEGEGEGEASADNDWGNSTSAGVTLTAQDDHAKPAADLDSLLHLPNTPAKVEYDVRLPHPRDEPQLRTVRIDSALHSAHATIAHLHAPLFAMHPEGRW